MKNNIIEYKGYCGSVDYSAEDNVLFGSVIGVRGLISYEGKSTDELKADFEEAVDSYLDNMGFAPYNIIREKSFKKVTE